MGKRFPVDEFDARPGIEALATRGGMYSYGVTSDVEDLFR
jgi:hypothetical protein